MDPRVIELNRLRDQIKQSDPNLDSNAVLQAALTLYSKKDVSITPGKFSNFPRKAAQQDYNSDESLPLLR